MTRGTLDIVVGGQFGSEGKGAVGAWLARNTNCSAAVRVAGPNAGHSAYDNKGVKWALRQIPVAAVADPFLDVVIGAGSEIDETVLGDEIARLEAGGIAIRNRLHIDRSATVLTADHIAAEQRGLTERLGSTAKGIGAARADRIWRQAVTWGEEVNHEEDNPVSDPVAIPGTDTVAHIRNALRRGDRVMIEGTQGYGLGMHTEHYPKCTSSDCRAVDFAAMAGITPWTDAAFTWNWVVLRTYPIRVAGNSGELKSELDWDTIGVPEERTTVTQKVRRVGEWDPELAIQSVEANGGGQARVALTFFDYWYPELAGSTSKTDLLPEHLQRVHDIERQIGATVYLLGTGPNSMIWMGGPV